MWLSDRWTGYLRHDKYQFYSFHDMMNLISSLLITDRFITCHNAYFGYSYHLPGLCGLAYFVIVKLSHYFRPHYHDTNYISTHQMGNITFMLLICSFVIANISKLKNSQTLQLLRCNNKWSNVATGVHNVFVSHQ